MKAKDICVSQNVDLDYDFSKVIVRLGGFHLLMSCLGARRYLVGGSGLSELWTTVFGTSSVPHMLTGHAYTRAIRAHLLTYCALSKIIFSELILRSNIVEMFSQTLQT